MAITAGMVKELREMTGADRRRHDGLQKSSYRDKRRYGCSC